MPTICALINENVQPQVIWKLIDTAQFAKFRILFQMGFTPKELSSALHAYSNNGYNSLSSIKVYRAMKLFQNGWIDIFLKHKVQNFIQPSPFLMDGYLLDPYVKFSDMKKIDYII